MQDDSAMVLQTKPRGPAFSSKMQMTSNTTIPTGRQLAVVQEEDDPFFFSEFLYFCSSKFCLGDDTHDAAIEDDHLSTMDDSRNSIAKRRSSDLDNNTRNKDDSWSCDSTLESSGIFSLESPQQKFRFFVDPKLSVSADDTSVATLASADDRSLSLKERWNALYTPNSKLVSPKDARSLKTEGAKPNSNNTSLWNLSILESTPNCASFDSRVLGTSTADDATKPIVLTASIMDALQRHLPYSKQGEMFWLKYSMVRDGANLNTVLNKTKVRWLTVCLKSVHFESANLPQTFSPTMFTEIILYRFGC
jgi:hypothetical protein